MGDILSDVSREKEGDGARQLDDTHDGPYPDPLPKMHTVLDFWVNPCMFSGMS